LSSKGCVEVSPEGELSVDIDGTIRVARKSQGAIAKGDAPPVFIMPDNLEASLI
jgi:hypothetical protein